jgi:hypothetical protein
MTQMTPERAGPLIHVKALRGSNAYAYFWLSEGLRRWPNGYDVAPEAGRNQRLDPAHASQPPPLIASPRNLVGIFRLTYWCVTVAILLGWEKGHWKSTLHCGLLISGSKVRVLVRPPFTPSFVEISRLSTNNPGLAGFRTRESSSFGVAVSVASSLSMRPIFQRLSSRSFRDLPSNLAIQ